MGLWETVQRAIKKIAGNKTKSTRIRRIYSLSGLLRYKNDDSSFGGSDNWGRNEKWQYYYVNNNNNFRIHCSLLEDAAMDAVADIIGNTPRLRHAIVKYGKQIDQNGGLLKNHHQSAGT